MPKRRVSNSERSPHRAGKPSGSDLKLQRFAGVSLSGGKNSKTVISVLDYYPEHKKLILSKIIDDFKVEKGESFDSSLIETLKNLGGPLVSVGFDVPLSFPQCVLCTKKCPGVNECAEPHISWFWDHFQKIKKTKSTPLLFTPYTQRPVEAYLSRELEESFHPSDALGANVAPLTARMNFLLKHLQGIKCVEVFPKLSLWRMGRAMKITKGHLRFHKHSIEGDKSRLTFLNALGENNILFLYQSDVNKLISHGNAFDALLCALTVFLKHQNLTEPRPENFPTTEAWIEFPTVDCF